MCSFPQLNPMKIPSYLRLLLSTSQLTPKQSYFLLIFLFQISYFSCVSGQCQTDQRSLLLQLKNTLTYNSSLSTKLVYWNQNIDCCNWNGVECDSFGHVIGLELDNETISGGIEKPSALYRFRYLENLNLAYNNFNYLQIPREFGNMTKLTHLNLSYAEFAGKIPVELSHMTSLVMLDLSMYSYGLEYPNLKIFLQNLTRLEELYLDSVDFKHKGNWWEALSLALPNLRCLSLSNCGLSGHLNSSFLQLRTLSVLRLDGNDLSDTVLVFFANFRNLTVLSLSQCSLQGAFSPSIFQVPTLQHLDLSFNDKLSGTIPEFPSGRSLTDSTPSNLSLIDISHCNFTGPIPSTIGNLSKLVSLDFAGNSFTGPIPFSIGNLLNLVSLNFANNFFTGSIPIFRMCNKLEHLDLSYNNLNGSLSPTHFEGLSNLVELYLRYNSLTGNIPTSLFNLPSLQSLLLSHNKFSGQVNEFSTLYSNLEELDLRSNQLEGLIPKSFFRLKNLSKLFLSANFFNGTIQFEDFQSLQNLKHLHLGYNHLSVNIRSIHSELSLYLQSLSLACCNLSRFPNLRNQTDLNELDLSHNKISGEIPSWIWEIGNGSLSHLNLSHNFLTNLQTPYQIPSSIDLLGLNSNVLSSELPVFQVLPFYVDFSNNYFQGHITFDNYGKFFSVANNSLIGKIPESLCDVDTLEVLDLSGNFLSGKLPSCLLQNLTYLTVLNIGRNNIRGNIPDTFPVSCSLTTLDVSRNKLGGNIPPSVANCKSLQLMNVANNNLEGTFPCILRNSSSLHVLVLRSNKFFGDISCHDSNYNWPNLQIIDIAFNSFTGVGPGFISSLTGMKLKNGPRLSGHPLGFQEGRYIYYQDKVIVPSKGLELEFVKILITLTYIDFSSNKFRGAIPKTLGGLSSLYALNLSHNSFTGRIPRSLGNSTNLESLDLSRNQLTGNIPAELVSLIFLSFFNVSDNELVGRIPSGRQFETFSTASYVGNLQLCGPPTNQSCGSNVPTETSTTSTDKKDIDWMFMLAGIGYAVGVALVVVPPLLSRRWGERLEELQSKLLNLICRRTRA